MCGIYRIFADEFEGLDFSDTAMLEMFNAETYGGITPSFLNGFAQGKKWLSVQIAMWKKDIITYSSFGQLSRTLFVEELYEDSKYPHWWLDSIFNKKEKK